jgi:glycosyltransferase involved in cell wall biosynthesis
MKIALYSICKNEEKHVGRWFETAKQADGIFVVDTGSTDNTIPILEELQDADPSLFKVLAAIEYTKEEPFRFDHARQSVVDTITSDFDYIVFLDMDETMEDGWCDSLKSVLQRNPRTDAVYLDLQYDISEAGVPSITYPRLACTKRCSYIWRYPVHEVLVPKETLTCNTFVSDIKVFHYPDTGKPRSYLNLLLLGVSENSDDPRSYQYLAKEYMKFGRFEDAISTYADHIRLETDPCQKQESYRALSYCNGQLGQHTLVLSNLIRATWVAPFIRETWGDLADYYFKHADLYEAIGACLQMLNCPKETGYNYIQTARYYKAFPYHILAVCYQRLGDTASAKESISLALSADPTDVTVARDMCVICNIPITIAVGSKDEEETVNL